jgi:hypothetical protein
VFWVWAAKGSPMFTSGNVCFFGVSLDEGKRSVLNAENTDRLTSRARLTSPFKMGATKVRPRAV